jgi:hypothetical protein
MSWHGALAVGSYPGPMPVAAGQYIAIFANGLGPAVNTPADGAAALGSAPFATTMVAPTIRRRTRAGDSIQRACARPGGVIPGERASFDGRDERARRPCDHHCRRECFEYRDYRSAVRPAKRYSPQVLSAVRLFDGRRVSPCAKRSPASLVLPAATPAAR